jgi:hypothetical protein
VPTFAVHPPKLLQIKSYPECQEKAKWLTHVDTKMAKKIGLKYLFLL